MEVKKSPLKRSLASFRNLLFRNKFAESITVFFARYPFTYGLSRKMVVPVSQYPIGSLRSADRNGIKLKLDIANEVDHFIFFRFRETSFDWLTDEIKSSAVIFDIGGNIGAFALFFEKMAPNAAVHTFEPHPTTYSKLQENLKLNHSKVHGHNFGLGETVSKFKMYEIDSHNAGMNRIMKEDQPYPYKVIDINTLDQFWEDCGKIDFVKIDVEGFEFSVLKGGTQTIRKYSPKLVIELDDNNLKNNGSSAKELVSWLEGMGYTITSSDKKNSISSIDDFTDCHFDIYAKKD